MNIKKIITLTCLFFTPPHLMHGVRVADVIPIALPVSRLATEMVELETIHATTPKGVATNVIAGLGTDGIVVGSNAWLAKQEYDWIQKRMGAGHSLNQGDMGDALTCAVLLILNVSTAFSNAYEGYEKFLDREAIAKNNKRQLAHASKKLLRTIQGKKNNLRVFAMLRCLFKIGAFYVEQQIPRDNQRTFHYIRWAASTYLSVIYDKKYRELAALIPEDRSDKNPLDLDIQFNNA